MERCLITGGTGLIGRHVIALLRKKCELYTLVKDPANVTSDGIRIIRCDLAREWSSERFPPVVDAVINLAQSEHFREFPAFAQHILNVNTISTLKLLEFARKAKAKAFILASSGGIYGHGEEGFSEDQAIPAKDDLGFYLGTKLCAEVLAENYTPYMNVIILRFFFVYGPGQRATMLIPRLTKAVKEQQPIILHGKDGLRINPTYVTDAASAVCRSLQLTESHKINIGGPEVLSLRQIGQQIGEALHKEPVFEVNEHISPHHLIGDIKKMVHFLGQPSVKFKEGIEKYVKELDEERYYRDV